MKRWSSNNTYNHVKVPIEMCNYAVCNNIENPFRLFIYLKLKYPSGKVNWTIKERRFASIFLKVHTRTIDNNFNLIIKLEWIKFYKKKKYCRIISFDAIRLLYGWHQRRSFPFRIYYILNIRAILGAIIYTQLYKSNRRKHKRRYKNVRENGRANNFMTPSCKYTDYAQISVLGVSKIFKISISKAVRLKQYAKKAGYIKVAKHYSILDNNQIYAAMKGRDMRDENINVVCFKGKYAFQLIDKVYSELHFKKRKKLATL